MEYQSKFNDNRDHKISSWLIIAMMIIAYILGVITGSSRCNAQTPAMVRGYFNDTYLQTTTYVDYRLSEDNREMEFVFGNDTIHFDVWKEKMTILQDSVIRTEYILDKKSILIIEPDYSNGDYIGDYCKMIMRNSDVFDKIVFTFWSEPKWEEDIARYQ